MPARLGGAAFLANGPAPGERGLPARFRRLQPVAMATMMAGLLAMLLGLGHGH